MAVSPIRDEFVATAWTSIVRQVTFYNNADVAYTVYITTEDCEPGTNYWTPLCQATGSSWLDILKSSTWITTDESGMFTVAPHSNRVINYTVNVPPNAVPGGHYGAIFFNNPDMAVSGNAVKMNRRIGMLYLMTVPGNIVVDTNFWDILVDAGPGGWMSTVGPNSIMTLFSAPQQFIDETIKWLMMIFSDPVETENILNEINPIWEKPSIKEDEFLVTLKIPVENAGNTHVTPTGKIYLYDWDTRLERIWRQSIVDENGVYLGEKIVDFLPINDEWGNVLPNTDRTFSIDWAGFAYDDIDPVLGKRVVKFESPAEYYSRTAWSDTQMQMPWEKLARRTMNKELRASVEITYKNPSTGLDEVTTLELPVPIHYVYVAKVLNWSLLLLLLLIILLYWILKRRKNKAKVSSWYDDELSILKKAQSEMMAKKKTAKAPVKKVVNKWKKEAVKPTEDTVPAKIVPQKKTIAKQVPIVEEVTPVVPIKKTRATPKKKPPAPPSVTQ
jgi:hypothetical protein